MHMSQFVGYLATGLISLVVGLLLQRAKDKPRLLYWIPGSFIFELTQPQKFSLRTDSLTIQNVGRESAENIEIIHKVRPDHFQFSTAVSYREETLASGEHIIHIPRVGPREFVNIQLLSYTAMPVLLNIRSSEGPARQISVYLQRAFPLYVQYFAAFLILLGLGFLLYWIGAAVIYLTKAIGIL